MDNPGKQEDVVSKDACFVEPPEQERKVQWHSTASESPSKTAKILEL